MSDRTHFKSAALVGALTLVGYAWAVPAGAATRQVFVTSTTGNGNLATWAETDQTGLAGADEICRVRAAAASLPNATTYRAWVSTSTTDAYCHLFGLTGAKPTCNNGYPLGETMGPWLRRDGSPFAASLDRMTGSGHEVYQPILFSETGTAVPDIYFQVWTGTNENGIRLASTCTNWSFASPSTYGASGNTWSVGRRWSNDVSLTCDLAQNVRLACFEPGQGDPLQLPSASGALVFVTSVSGNGQLSTWPDALGQSGIAAGDVICQVRAAAAKLPRPESFVAWLSDANEDAKDRVTFGGPFVRVDGFLFAPSKSAITSVTPDLRTGLNVTEFGSYFVDPVGGSGVWTGTLYDGTATSVHCGGWTSALASDQGLAGESATTRFTWTHGGTPTCDRSLPLYCFSNVETLFWDNFERGNTSRWSSATP